MSGGMEREFDRVLFSRHAVERMFARDLHKDDVLQVIRTGDVIAEYPDDSPYPSCLLLGFVHSDPVHVVLATDSQTDTGIVVTAYRPEPEVWNDDFRTRRQA